MKDQQRIAAVCCLALVLFSVPASARGDSYLSGDEVTAHGEEGVRVTGPVERLHKDPVTGDGTKHLSEEVQRFSTRLPHWRLSSVSLLGRRPGRRLQLLKAAVLVAGAALVFSVPGRILLKCLGLAGSLEKSPGSRPRSLSDSPDECDSLLEEHSEQDVGTGAGGEPAPELFHNSGVDEHALLLGVLLAVSLAAFLAWRELNPSPPPREEEAEPVSPTRAPERGTVSRPRVVVRGDEVVIGEGWNGVMGNQAGSEVIQFPFEGRRFTVHLSRNLQLALDRHGVLQRFIEALSSSPTESTGRRVYEMSDEFTRAGSQLGEPKFVWGPTGPGTRVYTSWYHSHIDFVLTLPEGVDVAIGEHGPEVQELFVLCTATIRQLANILKTGNL